MNQVIQALEAARAAQQANFPGEPAMMIPIHEVGIVTIEGTPRCCVRYDSLIEALKQQVAS